MKAALGNWARNLNEIEAALLCMAINRYTNAGVYANDQTLPFFTRIAARDALIAAEPHLVERAQFLSQRLLRAIVNMEESSGENPRNN